MQGGGEEERGQLVGKVVGRRAQVQGAQQRRRLGGQGKLVGKVVGLLVVGQLMHKAMSAQ